MDFGRTDEHVQLAESERSWLIRHDPITRVRAELDSAAIGVDPAAVIHAAESGLLAMLTKEIGGTHPDLAVLSEAHGYAASALPLADLAIANWLLEQADVPETGQQADGAQLVGVARGPEVAVHGDVLALRGTTTPVPMAADLAGIAVIGTTGDGAEYLAIVRDAVVAPMTTLDLTRSWARCEIDATLTADRWTTLPSGTVGQVCDALAVHRALDSIGAAARLLDMTVTYAGQRHQFGVPIGSFQAVKHHCANMALRVEAGREVLWAAAFSLDVEDPVARTRAVSSASAYAKSAASFAAGIALQAHGGIGFTWEHDLHLFLRRIKVDEAVDGTVAFHRARSSACLIA
jgi:hypothetical protein